MIKIDYHSQPRLYAFDEIAADRGLTSLVKECVLFQREKRQAFLLENYKPAEDALEQVSENALRLVLARGTDVHGIASQRNISNCMVFNAPNIADALADEKILCYRRQVNERVHHHIRRIFSGQKIAVNDSGHFWYPPGCFMSWHTNSKSPGWRFYINYAEESGKSFFRYRDPQTGEIVTLWDQEWNFRIFKVDPAVPFWHAVYSNTHRYSFGYRITLLVTPSFNQRIFRRIGRWVNTGGGK